MALRETLSRQAGPSRAVPDLAGPAIRAARRIRRRRSAAAASVVAVAVAAATVSGWQLAGSAADRGAHVPVVDAARAVAPPAMTPTPTPTPSAEPLAAAGHLTPQPLAAIRTPPVDLVVAARLDTTDGERMDLSVLGTVTQARRGDEGWLVVATAPAGRPALWFVTPAHPPKPLLPTADAVALAPDGRHVSWLATGRTSVAAVTAGRLTGIRQTPVPPRSRPIGFVGDGVLLTRQLSGGEIEGYDIWWPERGPYQPAWNTSLIGVYGPLPDGRTVVAQVAGEAGRPCLALLDADRGLPVVKRACALPLAAGGPGTVSPDGRWLMANSSPSTPAGAATAFPAPTALLVELPTAFRPRPASRKAGPRLTGAAVWTDPGTVIHPGGAAELVRVSADRLADGDPTAVERVPVPGARPDDQLIVVPGAAG